MVLVQDFTEDKLQEWLAGFGALEEAWIQKDVCVKILNASFRILQPAAAKPVATTTTGATRENHQIAARMLRPIPADSYGGLNPKPRPYSPYS